MDDRENGALTDGFDIRSTTVGIIGYGFIGKAVEELFNGACAMRVYDKNMPELDALESVVIESDVIFVAVPTPMVVGSGRCHTGIVDSVMQDIAAMCAHVGRPYDDFVVVIKSTVPPGYTRDLMGRHPDMRIVFSPEFLTEANAVDDFKNARRVLLGGTEEDAEYVFRFFYSIWHERIASGYTQIVRCEPELAALVKLVTNAYLATKVMFANETKLLCDQMSLDHRSLMKLMCLDPRIGPSHLQVPGPDGMHGFGGHCLPKDLASLVTIFADHDVDERLFSAVLTRNLEIREHCDWHDMQGRAVIAHPLSSAETLYESEPRRPAAVVRKEHGQES